MSSKLSSIMDGIVTQVQGLNYQFNNATVTVQKKKVVGVEQGVDPAVLIVVAKAPTPELRTFIPAATLVRYPVDVALLAPNNADQSTNLDQEASFREQVRKLFKTQPNLGVSGVYETRPEMGVAWPKNAVARNWDAHVVRVWVRCTEPN